jgi:hypothetical protein
MAQRCIYILGWDLNPSLQLTPAAPRLLHLLKGKADVGIKIKIGLWKGELSLSQLFCFLL